MSQYFENSPNTSFSPRELHCVIREREFSFITSSGVFSAKRLDPGTRTLIESVDFSDQSILDLGCGCGIVGIVLQSFFPKVTMSYVDVNPLAITSVKKNLKKFGLTAHVYKDSIPDTVRFDAILLNPPFSAGREVCYALIQDSYAHLESDGVLYLVARKNKGGAMLEKKMHEIFGNVSIHARKRGFTVYASTR
ncbi:MAG: class I SAM-dependent methyltransferase [Candidatus Woesearchaeota archaeon]